MVNSKAQFISYWTDLVTRLSSNDITRQRLIIDILNEPDARGWGWDTMAVSGSGPQTVHRTRSVYVHAQVW